MEASSTGNPNWAIGNTNSRVANTLVHLLGSSDPGYNLQSFRLSLFENLPRRLGYSDALDAALTAFTSLLETRQSPVEQLSPSSLQLYFSGLKILQNTLANPTARYQPNTLCAAHIISECSTWIVRDSSISRGHSEGLAYLMSDLVHQMPDDSFLRSMYCAITSNLVGIRYLKIYKDSNNEEKKN